MIKAVIENGVSKTGKEYSVLAVYVVINGKELKVKSVFLSDTEKALLDTFGQ